MIRASEKRTDPAPATAGDSLPKHAAPGEPKEMLDHLADGIVLAERLVGLVCALHNSEFMPRPGQSDGHLDHLQALQRELKLAYAELATIDPDATSADGLGIEAALKRWRDAVAPLPIETKADTTAA
jgi:hypothetical protein